MSERDMRSRVVGALRTLDAISVENPAYPGTPDVNYVEGWVELKWLRDWPSKAETPVAFDHFTQQQKVWLIKRSRARGRVSLLICCKKEWLLFSPEVAVKFVGRATRQELIGVAQRYWPAGLNEKELIDELTGSRETVN